MPTAGRSVGIGAVRRAHGRVAGKVLATNVVGELSIKDLIVKGADALGTREQVTADSAAALASPDPQNAGTFPAAPQPAPASYPVVPVVCLRLRRKPRDPVRWQRAQPGTEPIDAHAPITAATSFAKGSVKCPNLLCPSGTSWDVARVRRAHTSFPGEGAGYE